ncbi:Chlorate reductase subunit alpha [Lentibacillus sp. JNUCC-1]|nr:Chlorate reductase subunit alpha [Lentibacillus sp. JNUCC-1]
MKKTNKLLSALKHLREGNRINDGFTEESPRPRDAEDIYRRRWQHDKVVRSTHGVNCTGSCSWKIYVKDGIITSEVQQTDYPSTGDDFPEYEPRGCPRGASFSWYTYSPVRVKYPYIRGDLYELWKAERNNGLDPVEAWESIVGNPEKRQQYVNARGKGGFVRASWREMCEIIASASIHTIKQYGPDRVVGFSPIPAMSMVSYAAGTRFLSLIGGTILSFYDWYADLPLLPRKCGVNKLTCLKVPTGIIRNTLSSGAPICRKHGHLMHTLWWKHDITALKSLVSARTMRNTRSLQTYGSQPNQVQTALWQWQ